MQKFLVVSIAVYLIAQVPLVEGAPSAAFPAQLLPLVSYKTPMCCIGAGCGRSPRIVVPAEGPAVPAAGSAVSAEPAIPANQQYQSYCGCADHSKMYPPF